MGWGLHLLVPYTISLKAHTRFMERQKKPYPHISEYYRSQFLDKAVVSCLVDEFLSYPTPLSTDFNRGVKYRI